MLPQHRHRGCAARPWAPPICSAGSTELYLESQQLGHRQQCQADGFCPRCVLWDGVTREEKTVSISEGCSAPACHTTLSPALPAWHSLPLPATSATHSLPVLWGGGCPSGLTPTARHHCCAGTAEVASGWVEACSVCPPPAAVTSCHCHTSRSATAGPGTHRWPCAPGHCAPPQCRVTSLPATTG